MRRPFYLATAVTLLAATLACQNLALAAEPKVAICHVPPGNPQNHQTINVGASAVGAHLAHGDTLGECASGCQANANVCDDGNLCTQDTCKADGQCSHETISCDDSNACTEDVCVESVGCTYVPASDPCQSTSCNDGNACTTSDICADGACKGTPVAGCCATDADCSDGNDCTDDACTGNVCFNTQKTCTSENACLAPICTTPGGCTTAPVHCDDANACTDDSCDQQTGCTFTPTNNPPQPTEISCGDGQDNDCDGFVDANDSDCPQCSCFHCTPTLPAADGTCQIQFCDSGFGNCDGLASNGCESDLNNNPLSCGACGTICNFANATAGCTGGQCTVVACNPGFQNCDGIPQNGCERQTMQCP